MSDVLLVVILVAIIFLVLRGFEVVERLGTTEENDPDFAKTRGIERVLLKNSDRPDATDKEAA
jgi:hypothetical protein